LASYFFLFEKKKNNESLETQCHLISDGHSELDSESIIKYSKQDEILNQVQDDIYTHLCRYSFPNQSVVVDI